MELWKRISDWFKQNCEDAYEALNNGASDDDIAELRSRFPFVNDELLNTLRINDGQDPYESNLWDGFYLLSVANCIELCEEWESSLEETKRDLPDALNCESDGPVKPDYWNNKWIPILGTFEGHCICLDFDPAEGGAIGQVIAVWSGEPERAVKAESIQRYFEDIEQRLLNEKYQLEDGQVFFE